MLTSQTLDCSIIRWRHLAAYSPHRRTYIISLSVLKVSRRVFASRACSRPANFFPVTKEPPLVVTGWAVEIRARSWCAPGKSDVANKSTVAALPIKTPDQVIDLPRRCAVSKIPRNTAYAPSTAVARYFATWSVELKCSTKTWNWKQLRWDRKEVDEHTSFQLEAVSSQPQRLTVKRFSEKTNYTDNFSGPGSAIGPLCVCVFIRKFSYSEHFGPDIRRYGLCWPDKNLGQVYRSTSLVKVQVQNRKMLL